MVLLIAAACVGQLNLDSGNGSGVPGHDSGVEPIPGDTSEEPEDTGDTGEEPDGYDFLFGLDKVHTIDIVLSDEAKRALRNAPKEYVDGAVVVDGEAFEHVGVRLKGSGSFADLSGKAAFKIDFNRFDADQSFHGKGKLTLNNMTHDETQVHEVVAYAAFAAAGLPAARVGYAWVTVNEEDYGLYSNVETADRDYLERNFGNRDGNLYEGGYPYYPDSWDHADFTSGEVDHFQLESGTDVEWDDLEAVVQAMKAADMEPALGELVDLDQYARFQIMESWTGQWDGYAFASNNFRVFVDHGATGKLYMVPTGLDYCFTSYGGSRMMRASSPLGAECQGDDACKAHFDAVIEDTMAKVEAANLDALMLEAEELTRPYVEDDPRNYIDEKRALDVSLGNMHEWIATQSEKVGKWYGAE